LKTKELQFLRNKRKTKAAKQNLLIMSNISNQKIISISYVLNNKRKKTVVQSGKPRVKEKKEGKNENFAPGIIHDFSLSSPIPKMRKY
jgi:hypothetical protein